MRNHATGTRLTALVCLAVMTTLAVRPALADDVPLATLFDLSADASAQREIAVDVARSLKRSKQVRFRDIDESLNVGGEELIVSGAKSGEGLSRSGMQKLKAGKYEDAAEDFDNAVSSFLTAYAHLPDMGALARAMALLGVAQLLGGHAKAATAAFTRAAQADPRYDQDFSEFPSKVQQAFDAARKDVLARPKVDFDVKTTPPYAKVYVNGTYMGLSPTYVSSLAGEQFIALSKNGYARKAAVATVEGGGEVIDHSLDAARRGPAFEKIRERLAEIFDGAVEPNDLTEAEGLCATPYAIALRATGTREKMKIELALANLSGRQVVNRIAKDTTWLRRDKALIDRMVDDLLRAPEVPTDVGPAVKTQSVLKKWWFWTLVGGVLVGSVAVYLIASQETPTQPKYQPGQGGLLIQF